MSGDDIMAVLSFLLGVFLSYQTGRLTQTSIVAHGSPEHDSEWWGWLILAGLYLIASGVAMLESVLG